LAKKKLKCLSCGGDHYINNCPDFLEFKKMKEEEKQAAATWDATTFVIYQVNAIGAESIEPTKVLQDNQANRGCTFDKGWELHPYANANCRGY
jgi:hypothetical protein